MSVIVPGRHGDNDLVDCLHVCSALGVRDPPLFCIDAPHLFTYLTPSLTSLISADGVQPLPWGHHHDQQLPRGAAEALPRAHLHSQVRPILLLPYSFVAIFRVRRRTSRAILHSHVHPILLLASSLAGTPHFFVARISLRRRTSRDSPLTHTPHSSVDM